MGECKQCGRRSTWIDKYGLCKKCHNAAYIQRMKRLAGDASPDAGKLYVWKGPFRQVQCRLCGASWDIEPRTGYCKNCIEKLELKAKSPSKPEITANVQISLSRNGHALKDNGEYADLEPEEEEREACQAVIDELADFDGFEIQKRALRYTTLKYKDYDVMRIALNDTERWLSVSLSQDDRDAYEDDARFDAQTNKKQLMWKADLYEWDVSDFVEFIQDRCEEIDSF